MNDFKEWYCGHIDDCEYCQRVDESTILSSNRKSELIDAHTMDAFAGLADLVHDNYMER